MAPLNTKDLTQFLKFANSTVDQASALVLDLYKQPDLGEEEKSDASPVTIVDLKTEELIRAKIIAAYPTHGIIGEEYENTNPTAEFQWTIDPIDGTQNLARRVPTFGVLLGLRFQGEAILGVIDHPALEIRTHGAVGLGVWQNGDPLRPLLRARPSELRNEVIGSSARATYERQGQGEAFERLLRVFPFTRIYFDCYTHTLTIARKLAACVEFGQRLWDITPVEALIVASGGSFKRLSPAGGRPAIGKELTSAVMGDKGLIEPMITALAVPNRLLLN